MSEHKQMQPPDYHRCLETVLSSPGACREFLERLSTITETDLQPRWSPWPGQEPPPYGPDVKKQVPAEIALAMLQATYDDYRKSTMALWRQLFDIMDIPVMQESLAELIGSVRMRIQRLEGRIQMLESTAAGAIPSNPEA